MLAVQFHRQRRCYYAGAPRGVGRSPRPSAACQPAALPKRQVLLQYTEGRAATTYSRQVHRVGMIDVPHGAAGQSRARLTRALRCHGRAQPFTSTIHINHSHQPLFHINHSHQPFTSIIHGAPGRQKWVQSPKPTCASPATLDDSHAGSKRTVLKARIVEPASVTPPSDPPPACTDLLPTELKTVAARRALAIAFHWLASRISAGWCVVVQARSEARMPYLHANMCWVWSWSCRSCGMRCGMC